MSPTEPAFAALDSRWAVPTSVNMAYFDPNRRGLPMLLSDSRMSLRSAALAALAASLLATSSSWAAGRKQSAEEPPEDAFSG